MGWCTLCVCGVELSRDGRQKPQTGASLSVVKDGVEEVHENAAVGHTDVDITVSERVWHGRGYRYILSGRVDACYY